MGQTLTERADPEELAKWVANILVKGHSEASERVRVNILLRRATLDEVVEFAKSYDGLKRCFPSQKIENSSKAKPGDFVYEVDKPTEALVYIGSVRTGQNSTRLVVRLKDRTLRRSHNIRNLSEPSWVADKPTCWCPGTETWKSWMSTTQRVRYSPPWLTEYQGSRIDEFSLEDFPPGRAPAHTSKCSWIRQEQDWKIAQAALGEEERRDRLERQGKPYFRKDIKEEKRGRTVR